MWASHDEGEKIDRTFAKELAELKLLISAAEKEKKEADEALLSTGWQDKKYFFPFLCTNSFFFFDL